MSTVALAPGRTGTSSAVPVAIVIFCLQMLLSAHLWSSGYDQTSDYWSQVSGWEQGSFLRLFVLWAARSIDALGPTGRGVVIIYALLAASSGALLLASLCRSDWPLYQALAAVGLIATTGPFLFASTSGVPDLILVLSVGLLIPVRRQLEASGDVQSVISLGLALPLLALVGPPTAVLLPFLVLAVPLRDKEARADTRIFAALLLVAVVPTTIICAGATLVLFRNGMSVSELAQPFLEAFSLKGQSPPLKPILFSIPIVALTVVLHLLVPDRRRQVRTSMMVLAIPVYIATGNQLFSWNLLPVTPALTLLATVSGWLAGTRLRPWMRLVTIGLLLLGNAASWILVNQWATNDWFAALISLAPSSGG